MSFGNRWGLIPVLGCICSVAGCVAVLSLIGFCPRLAAESIPVGVSILPEKYLVERVGGPNMDVCVMIGPGQNPATFEPSTAQLDAIKTARVYFRLGVPFESAWMKRLLVSNHYMMRVVNVAEEIRQRTMEPIGDEGIGRAERVPDPHMWMSPPLAKRMAARIRDTLVDLDPVHKDDYERNYLQLAAELDALDTEIRDRLAPLKHRTFMTSHPAWGYFADTYGLRQIPIESTGKEPDADTLRRIIDEAKRQGVKVILVEPQFSRSRVEMVAREIGGRVVVIDPLAEDYAGNMRKVAAAFGEGLQAK